MKILHIVFSLTNGGIENLLIDVANLQAKKNDVGIVIVNNLYDETMFTRFSPDIRLKLYNREPASQFLTTALNMGLHVAKFKPDIIHLHSPNLIIPLYVFRNRTVCTIHNVRVDNRSIALNKNLISISRSVQEDIKKRYGKRSTLVYNAIETDKVVAKAETEAPDQPFRIVQVSRLFVKQKGQDILIRAFKRISRLFPQASLTLIGEGESKAMLEQLIEAEQLQGKVELIGNKDRKWVYENLHQYDLFVQPSRFEGFGLTVVEAMLSGLPVIVSNVDGPMEIIENGRYGTYFENENTEDLFEKIKFVIEHHQHPEFKNKLKEAQQHCRQTFDITQHVHSLSQLYNDILRRKPYAKNEGTEISHHQDTLRTAKDRRV